MSIKGWRWLVCVASALLVGVGIGAVVNRHILTRGENGFDYGMFRLSQDEIRAYEEMSSKGDVIAMRRLYSHYKYIEGNMLQIEKWLKMAADRGDHTSMYEYGAVFGGNAMNPHRPDALKYLHQLAGVGDGMARRLLQQYEGSGQSQAYTE